MSKTDIQGVKRNTFPILLRLLLIGIIPLILMSVSLSVYSIRAIRESIQERVLEGLKATSVTLLEAYKMADSADYQEIDGLIYKGDYLISNNNDILDVIKKNSGFDVTVFYGDTRIATSIVSLQTGERAVGTKASNVVIEQVLNNGKEYSDTNVSVNEVPYYGYYYPMKNEKGEVIGMAFAGRSKAEMDAYIQEKTSMNIRIAVLVSIGAIIVSILGALSISQGVKKAEHIILELSNGNLNVVSDRKSMKRKDEIGSMSRALENLIRELKNTLGNIKSTSSLLLTSGNALSETAEKTSSTTDDIGQAIDGISKGAVAQAEDIEDAFHSIRNMGNIISEIVKSVSQLDDTSIHISQIGDESVSIVGELSKFNDKTTNAISKIAEQIHATNDSVQMIRQAIEIITSIAGQTRLLSLNASIEAARAGEHGRGFSVVASEIQQLANQSSESAKTIQDIIGKLLKESEMTVKVMEEVEIIVAKQQEKLEETKNKFVDVNKGIHLSKSETEVIKGYTAECSASKGTVESAIQNLSAVSQQNAAAAQETTAAMEEFIDTVAYLANTANELKTFSNNLDENMRVFQI